MKSAKPCPSVPLPVPPVNVILPLPLTPSPTQPFFLLGATTTTPQKPTGGRRRSSTFTAITNWALAVQPGSPAPNSPQNVSPNASARHPSISLARGIISRRPSISHNRAPSDSSLVHLIEPPRFSGYKQAPLSSANKQFNFNLTSLGYTSVFVQLDHTPSTPSPFRTRNRTPSVAKAEPAESFKGLKKIKSLGMLKPMRNRRKSVSAAATPESPSPRPRSHSRSGSFTLASPMQKAKSHSRSKSVSATTPSKKSRKAAVPPLPPTLASELLLRQFADGGSLEKHAKRVMEEQAREAAPAGSSSRNAPAMGTVFRDEQGTMWWDEDEKLERDPLLPGTPGSSPREWITFNPNGTPSPVLPGIGLGVGAAAELEERRGSLASTSSLSPSHIVTHADGSAYVLNPVRHSPPISPSICPSSPTRAPMSPMSPTSSVSTTTGLAAASGSAAQNKRIRRRPAPLRLNSSSMASSNPDAFEDSFAPSPRAVALASVAGASARRRSSTGGLSAPPACTEFASRRQNVDADGDVVMKGSIVDENDGASLQTVDSRKALGMKKISRLNLKVRAKALFGGLAQ